MPAFDDHTQRMIYDINELQRLGLIEQTPAGSWTLTNAGHAAVEEINNERPYTLTAKGRELASDLLDNTNDK